MDDNECTKDTSYVPVREPEPSMSPSPIHCFLGEDKSKCHQNWLPSTEVLITDAVRIQNSLGDESNVIKIGPEKLQYLKKSTILNIIKDEKLHTDENISLAEDNHSDLIPSKYEGGLKLWECTHDIANYLDPIHVSRKTVLDLGCGIGFLGILALKLGADTVHFQDYNVDVLRYATIPNLQLNVEPQQVSRCKFFSGDWESFAKLNPCTFDLVISSETIYNADNYLKLHDTIQKLLKATGVALIGAKTYYFGVGGSTRQFEKLVRERDIFNIDVVWKTTQGIQREILKLTFKTGEFESSSP